LTPAIFEEPRLKKNVDSQYQGCLENQLKNWGGHPVCDWTENLKSGEIVGSQPIESSLRNVDKK
jgi:hypothetical protein